MDAHDGSSKHNWRAKIQLNSFPCVPKTLMSINIVFFLFLFVHSHKSTHSHSGYTHLHSNIYTHSIQKPPHSLSGTQQIDYYYLFFLFLFNRLSRGQFVYFFFLLPVVKLVAVDGMICVCIIVDWVGCTGSGFGGDEKIIAVSQHSRSGNSLPFTQ